MDSTPASHESRFLNRGLLKIASIDELKAGVIKTLDDYQGKSGKVADVKLLEAVFEFALDQRNVAVEILTCSTFEALHDLSDRYRYTLLVPIRAGGGKSPLSENSSRTFGELDSIVKDLLEVPRGFDRQIMRELASIHLATA
ncbi:hypothetical protein FRB90_004209 [Tulasnella sp. 427]|nr:hypothetical protein FRB90_004209 [Tulasnella sp. 427]